MIRRLLEAGTRTLPLLALLFVPIALGLHAALRVGARRSAVAHDPVLQHKSAVPERAASSWRAPCFYFAVWILLAYFLNKLVAASRTPGRTASVDAAAARHRRAAGLLLMGLTITFASVDWAMSLDPHWFSTIYGVLFMVGQALSALAFVIVVMAALLARAKPFAGVVQPRALPRPRQADARLRDAVGLHAFSQFLIIWSGNLPEEIPWYLRALARRLAVRGAGCWCSSTSRCRSCCCCRAT